MTRFNSSLDALGGKPRLKSNSLKRMYDLMTDFDLIDICRVRNPTLRQFSWRRKHPEMKMTCLDFFLISDTLQPEVETSKFLSPLQSHHSPAVLKLRSADSAARERGYWKFNNSLLNDAEFVTEMKEFICQVLKKFNSFDDPRVNGEFLKYKIRQKAKKSADTKSKFQKEKRKHLENEVVHLENELVENNSEPLISEYETAKKELDIIYNHITDGIILRSRARWYEEGEKSTKYFLYLEKSNKAKTHIRRLLRCESSMEELIDPKII